MVAPMMRARSDFACCRVGNKVYVIGGWTGGITSTKTVEVYNLDANTWNDGVDLPEGDWGLRGSAVRNIISI